MTAAPTYHVRLAESGWAVSEGSGRAGETLPSKRAAIAEAYRLAATCTSARVVVHYTDNTVEREYRFYGESRPVRRS
jgi:hypothetical protein